MTQDESRQAAVEALRTHGPDDSVLLDEFTVERPLGWVYHYQSKRYLETGKFVDRLVGNGPIYDRWGQVDRV